MLGDFYFSKDLWSVGCGSAGFDASNEQSFGVPYKKWYVKVSDIYLRILGSIQDFT